MIFFVVISSLNTLVVCEIKELEGMYFVSCYILLNFPPFYVVHYAVLEIPHSTSSYKSLSPCLFNLLFKDSILNICAMAAPGSNA